VLREYHQGFMHLVPYLGCGSSPLHSAPPMGEGQGRQKSSKPIVSFRPVHREPSRLYACRVVPGQLLQLSATGLERTLPCEFLITTPHHYSLIDETSTGVLYATSPLQRISSRALDNTIGQHALSISFNSPHRFWQGPSKESAWAQGANCVEPTQDRR
jgi:hypothetical protein